MSLKAKRTVRDALHDPLFLEVIAALGAGNIDRVVLHDKEDDLDMPESTVLHGICYTKSGKILLNPYHILLETAIHELIHRVRPDWSERTVRGRTTRIFRALSGKQVDKLVEILEERINHAQTVRKNARQSRS